MFVITGGGTGIGAALARQLVSLGESVLVVGRRPAPLEILTRESQGIQCLAADISSADGRAAVVKHLQNLPLIKGLIHNAGTIDPIMPMQSISPAQWHQTMATNVDAPLFLTQLLLDKLAGGRVLNIGSGAAYFPVKGWAAYCVSKAALSMLTRSWQLECNDPLFASVMPGIIDTDMQAVIRQADNMAKDKLDFFLQLHAQGRLISPETVAVFLAWLLIEIKPADYVSKEWDIYDSSHHSHWLRAPHYVPALDRS